MNILVGSTNARHSLYGPPGRCNVGQTSLVSKHDSMCDEDTSLLAASFLPLYLLAPEQRPL